MKHVGAVILFVLFVSFAVRAQENAVGSSRVTAESTLAYNLPSDFAVAKSASEAVLPNGSPAPASASLPQIGVQSVFPTYNWQLYGGYTFVRFYAFPGREVNRNGFDIGMSYYVHSGYFGLEGALTTTFGSIAGERSDFVFAGGGPRVRWSAPRGIELWAHGLAGGANFGPSIAGFGQSTVAYELGGGVDVNAHRQRLAYRVEADMVGTRLYAGSQYSPKVSVGIVFKF